VKGYDSPSLRSVLNQHAEHGREQDSDIRLQKRTVRLTAELQGQIYKKKGKGETKNRLPKFCGSLCPSSMCLTALSNAQEGLIDTGKGGGI